MTTFQEAQAALYADLVALAEAHGLILPPSPGAETILGDLDQFHVLTTAEAHAICYLYMEADTHLRGLSIEDYAQAVGDARAAIQERAASIASTPDLG